MLLSKLEEYTTKRDPEKNEYNIIILTKKGYIKRQPLDYFGVQRHGGCGISGITLREGDEAKKILVVSDNDFILFFTNKGKVFCKNSCEIEQSGRLTKGLHTSKILELEDDEAVTCVKVFNSDMYDENKFLTIITNRGIVKRTRLLEYCRMTKIGIVGISLDENDKVCSACITSGHDELIVATKKGYAIRFKESDARELGRTAHGVTAIELREGDEVVGMEIVEEGKKLLTISEGGKGRRSEFSDYSIQNRGGKGLCNYRNSGVIVIKSVTDDDNAILIASEGKVLCIAIKEINVQFRGGSGICVMKQVSESSKIADVVIINKKLH